jgi:hypothetical protein
MNRMDKCNKLQKLRLCLYSVCLVPAFYTIYFCLCTNMLYKLARNTFLAQQINNSGCVCEGGLGQPCARGVQAPVFAALAHEQAWLSGVKIDAGAWLLGNANFQHFCRAWPVVAHHWLVWAHSGDGITSEWGR